MVVLTGIRIFGARLPMQIDWILDVLADLRTFAERNGLPRLAEELDDTRRRAALELAAHDPAAGNGTADDGQALGSAREARSDGHAPGAANFDF
jgi:hypothetical protein